MSNNKIKIDSDKLITSILRKGYTPISFADSIGRSKSYIYNITSRGWCLDRQLEYICGKLDIQIKDVFPDPEPDPEPEPEPEQKPQQMQIEFDRESINTILDAFKALDERLDAMEQKLLQAASGNSAPDMLTKHEKAVLLLKQMSLYNARIEEIDYIKKCNELGIDTYTRNRAIKKLDGDVQKLGYGNNTKRVIILNR